MRFTPRHIIALLCLLAVLLAAFTLTPPSGGLLFTLPPPVWILLFTLALLTGARIATTPAQPVRLCEPDTSRPFAPRPPPFVR